MTERINWTPEDRGYQPRIRRERIQELYQIRVELGLPMSVALDLIISEYYKRFMEEKEGYEVNGQTNDVYVAPTE
jgi:hypothetical protein